MRGCGFCGFRRCDAPDGGADAGHASSQSGLGGTAWYAQVKVTQGYANDAFDALNNAAALRWG